MHLQAFRPLLLSVLFAITMAPLAAFAQSLSDAELQTLNAHVIELYQAGKYSEAIPQAERYATATAARYSENAPQYASALNNLAVLLKDANRLSEAEPLMRRALDIDKKSFGPDHPNVARDLNNLAALLREGNGLSEPEPRWRRGGRIGPGP